MKQGALAVAGIVFALIALMHLCRLYFKFSVIVGTTFVPFWVNAVGLIIAAALSFWMFYALKMQD